MKIGKPILSEPSSEIPIKEKMYLSTAPIA
jgi:hypothetical protein